MKEKTTASISLEDVTEELVIEYLCTHPEFFQTHEDLLENLHIPHTCGRAISLIERQVQMLRHKNQLQNAELMNTTHIARENERIFGLTKKLTLQLLKSRDWSDALSELHKMLTTEFNVDYVRIGLTKSASDQLPELGEFVFPYVADEQPVIKDLLKVNKAICKRLSNEQLLYFFSDKMKKVHSCAIIPIGRQGMHGFLALGSTDKVKFHRNKDTLFLDYIGKVLGHIQSLFFNLARV